MHFCWSFNSGKFTLRKISGEISIVWFTPTKSCTALLIDGTGAHCYHSFNFTQNILSYYVSYSYSLGYIMCRSTLHMGVSVWASKCAHVCKICQYQIVSAFWKLNKITIPNQSYGLSTRVHTTIPLTHYFWLQPWRALWKRNLTKYSSYKIESGKRASLNKHDNGGDNKSLYCNIGWQQCNTDWNTASTFYFCHN
jgi:hypothetical protein